MKALAIFTLIMAGIVYGIMLVAAYIVGIAHSSPYTLESEDENDWDYDQSHTWDE